VNPGKQEGGGGRVKNKKIGEFSFRGILQPTTAGKGRRGWRAVPLPGVNPTNYFGAATHDGRRFQFRLVNRLFRVLPGFMGKSLVIAVRSSTKRNNTTR